MNESSGLFAAPRVEALNSTDADVCIDRDGRPPSPRSMNVSGHKLAAVVQWMEDSGGARW